MSHRLFLSRSISTHPPDDGVLFVMLNPSTADDTIDDPTIRKCKGFAKRFGFSRLGVVNLFSLRATKPADLWRAPERERNLIPKSNDAIIDAIPSHSLVVVAWGGHGARRAAETRVHEVDDLLRRSLIALGRSPHLWRIGMPNDDGTPAHPLMLSYDRQLQLHRPDLEAKYGTVT